MNVGYDRSTMVRKPAPTFECPHCGARVKRGALACPECGADELTGWDEDGSVWGAEIPSGYSKDDDFDYDEFLAREGMGSALAPKRVKQWAWRGLVILVLVAFVLWLVGL